MGILPEVDGLNRLGTEWRMSAAVSGCLNWGDRPGDLSIVLGMEQLRVNHRSR